MAASGVPQQTIAQMYQELEVVRHQLNAMTEQNRKAAEEIARLRNPVGPQNGPRPFLQNSTPGSFVQSQQQGQLNPNPQLGAFPPQHLRPPLLNDGSRPIQQTFQNSAPPFPGGPQNFPPPFQSASQTRAAPDLGDPVAQRLKMLEEQNERVLSLLAKLPGAAVPVDVEPKYGFQASPYTNEIATVEVPKKYNIPVFTPKYSGMTDPTEHVAQYKQLMWTISIPTTYQEEYMCKSFGATLTGPALHWLINLKPKSIGSFAELVNQFSQQFASSRKMEKQTSDLYYVVQKAGEPIRSYFNRFNAEMISIRNCDVKTAIEAYKRGLDDSSGLYTDLTKYPPETFEDVRARTLAYMRVETWKVIMTFLAMKHL